MHQGFSFTKTSSSQTPKNKTKQQNPKHKKPQAKQSQFLTIWEVLYPVLDGWQKPPDQSPTSNLQVISFPKDFLSKGLHVGDREWEREGNGTGSLCRCHWGLLVFSTSLEFFHEFYHQSIEIKINTTGP